MGPKRSQKLFFQIFIKLYIFKNFCWFFYYFFYFWTQMDPKWDKLAENGTKKGPKIFFPFFLSNYVFLRIFGDFSRFFWLFFYYWTQNEPKWLKMGPKRPQKYFFLIFIKVCIFTNFWWFFQIFLTILDFWGPGTYF